MLGGLGFFGRAVTRQLRAEGLTPLVGSRRAQADVVVDVESKRSLYDSLCEDDLVIDVAGPYQIRSTALVESAMEMGFDVIDLSDNLRYVRDVYRLRDQIHRSGRRVLTACSTVSTISAACLRVSRVEHPLRITGILVPATKFTAVAGTAASLFHSVGQPIEVFDNGKSQTRRGWASSRRFLLPQPIGDIRGYLFETADAFTLPSWWPSLRQVQFFVCTNVTGLNTLFSAATRVALLRRVLDRYQRLGLRLSRFLGNAFAGVGYEIESHCGDVVRVAFTAIERGYLIPIAPSILAAKKIVADEFPHDGLVPPNRHLDPQELIGYLDAFGIDFHSERFAAGER